MFTKLGLSRIISQKKWVLLQSSGLCTTKVDNIKDEKQLEPIVDIDINTIFGDDIETAMMFGADITQLPTEIVDINGIPLRIQHNENAPSIIKADDLKTIK